MSSLTIHKRKVTDSMKRRVAGIQRFTCKGNVPGYKCPLSGLPFDESGYDIDHIQPLSEGGTNEISNLQALCLMCHRVKSTRAASSVVVPVVIKKEKPKKVEVKPSLKKHYSVTLAGGSIKKFDDLDTLMQFVDKLVTKEGWSALGIMAFGVHMPVGDKMIDRLELFPTPNDRSNWPTLYSYKL